MNAMTQTGLGLLVMALAILQGIGAFLALLRLLDKYKPGAHFGEKVLLASLLAVAAVGALLMFIGSKL